MVSLNQDEVAIELSTFIPLLSLALTSGASLESALVTVSREASELCPFLSSSVMTAKTEDNFLDSSSIDFLLRLQNASSITVFQSFFAGLEVSVHGRADLSTILTAHLADSRKIHQMSLERLKKNILRRWLPHFIFFCVFVIPLIMAPIIGPAFRSTAIAHKPIDRTTTGWQISGPD